MLELFKGLDNVDEVEFFNKTTKVRVSEITFSHNNIDGSAYIEFRRDNRNGEILHIFRIDWGGKKFLYNKDVDVKRSTFTESDRDFVDRWNRTQEAELLTVEDLEKEQRIDEDEHWKYIFVGIRAKINNLDGSTHEAIEFNFRGDKGHLEEFIDDTGEFRIYTYSVVFDKQIATWGRSDSGEMFINSSFNTKNYRKYKDFLEAFVEAFGYSIPIEK